VASNCTNINKVLESRVDLDENSATHYEELAASPN